MSTIYMLVALGTLTSVVTQVMRCYYFAQIIAPMFRANDATPCEDKFTRR